MLMVCCIAFTTQGLTVNAAIVSGGKKNYSYKELKTDLKQLQKKYRDHCQVNVIGKTADKRNLYEVVIGNPNAKKHLLVIGNLHAREHMTVQLCMKQIEYYLNNYNKKINGKKVSATLNKVAIHYVPSCNPDGTAISQKGFNAIRNKSLRNGLRRMGGSSSKWKANARGVDLNRNWKVAFKKAGKKGSSGYRGPKAASEKEVQALVKWVNRIERRGKIAGVVSYHSTGSILYGRCASRATKKVRNITTRMYKLAKSLTRYHLMPTESISVADIANCGKKCGATAAARFLGEFVEKKPWVHLDIAGTSESDEDTEIYSKGGTGAATMLLYEVVKLMEKPYKSY